MLCAARGNACAGALPQGSRCAFRILIVACKQIMRSPCTSLYGNWRPTTGTESLQMSRKTKLGRAGKSMMMPMPSDDEGKRKSRGRPPVVIKSAVKEERLPDFVARAALVLAQNGGSMDSNLFGQHWKHQHPDNPIHSYKSNKGVTIHQMLRENARFFTVSDTTRQKVKFFELIPDEVQAFLSETNKEEGQMLSEHAAAPGSPLVANMAESVRGAVEGIDAPLEVETDEPVLVGVRELDHERDEIPAVSAAALEEVEEKQREGGVGLAPQNDAVVHDHVPGQGRARHTTGFDRRLKPKVSVPKEARVSDEFREVLPQAPTADERDAIVSPAVSLYNSWAMDGRDVVMEVTHAAAFEELWERVVEEKLDGVRAGFAAIDGGCGNGWAARRIAEHPLCKSVVGVDAAAVMVDRAESLSVSSDKLSFGVGDVAGWKPEAPVDLVNLCEVLYMLEDPQAALDHVSESWLKPGGLLIANLDCYWENKLSHAWEVDLGIAMHCLSEKQWEQMFEDAGLVNIKRWRSKSNGPWQGSLLMTGERKA
jgi:hypothetical protein